ncbi:DUF805 domain-containing protein [Gilliamella apicola]|uniref:DUF805 domain-containing protein n=1 Tax=unclassified Gilliamella TaxID=2685620 RepID=UPI001C400353
MLSINQNAGSNTNGYKIRNTKKQIGLLIALQKNYANFNGRTRRKEYWIFCLFSTILSILAIIIDQIIGSPFIITIILTLALFIPVLAVTVRCLLDTSKSDWWILLQFIP